MIIVLISKLGTSSELAVTLNVVLKDGIYRSKNINNRSRVVCYFQFLVFHFAKMSAKKTIELFYDVLSPYSWIAFEVMKGSSDEKDGSY